MLRTIQRRNRQTGGQTTGEKDSDKVSKYKGKEQYRNYVTCWEIRNFL